MESILNNIDEALIIADGDGRILYFNEVAFNLSKDILAKPLEKGDDMVHIVSQSRKETIRDMIRNMRVQKQSEKSFAEYVNRQGSTIYLELNYVPVTNDTNELTYIQTFARDITPQKIFEKKLIAQATNINNLIEKANAIIIGVDTQGYITDWNEYCSKITGFEKNEVYAQKFADVLLTKEEKYFDELLAKVLVNESVSNYEIPVRTKSNKKAIFLLNGTHRVTNANEITGVLFVGQDVTELTEYRRSLEKKVEERTRELQQALNKEKEVVEMKSRFVAIASHEFRTPLSSIEFAVKFIKGQKFQQDFHAEVYAKLEGIEKQVKHMTYLLDDVLTYGKSQAGQIQLILSKIDLHDFLNKIVEDVANNTKNTHVVKKEFSSLPGEISTDEKLLRSVLINLLTNAIKFSPEKSDVYLTVQGDRNQLMISVRDEGMGIPEDEVEKIFEPFIRGKAVAAIQGTGLGLAIVKKAVELLKGSIQAESKIDIGTTFTVRIPTNEIS